MILTLPTDKKDEKLCSKKSGFDPRTFGSVTDGRQAPKLEPLIIVAHIFFLHFIEIYPESIIKAALTARIKYLADLKVSG
jgi:hypothetical protein